MKILGSLCIAACAALGAYGAIFTSEPADSAVAVPVGGVFAAVFVGCLVIVGGGRRAGRARSRGDARRAAVRPPAPSAAYRTPPREWHDVCDARDQLERVRELHARGILSAEDVREVEFVLADARRAWRRTGWHR
jgi:hypothetical protein